MIAVEGTIFAFGFSKKYDLLLLLIDGRVLNRCQSFDRLASVNAHLCGLYDTCEGGYGDTGSEDWSLACVQ